MKLFLAVFASLLTACATTTAKPQKKTVTITHDECGDNTCVIVSYKNRSKRSICVRDAEFSHDGDLRSNIFKLTSRRTNQVAEYLPIEPSIVLGTNYAVLVRLFRPGATGQFRIVLSDFYDMKPGDTYIVEYQARAYWCDDFGATQSYVLLEGKLDRE